MTILNSINPRKDTIRTQLETSLGWLFLIYSDFLRFIKKPNCKLYNMGYITLCNALLSPQGCTWV